jgi:hypothetical protein
MATMRVATPKANPLAIAEGGDVFGADSGDGLQQELGEIVKGDGVLAGDASLHHQEKGL